LPARDCAKLCPFLKRLGFLRGESQRPRPSRPRARSAGVATQAFLAAHARLENRDFALLDASALTRTDRETGLRVLSALLLAVSGKVYRPRFDRLEPLFDAIIGGTFAGARTLSGCRIGRAPKARAVFGPETPPDCSRITPQGQDHQPVTKTVRLRFSWRNWSNRKPVWRIRNSQVLGPRAGRISDSKPHCNLLNLVWFSDLKFLDVNATII